MSPVNSHRVEIVASGRASGAGRDPSYERQLRWLRVASLFALLIFVGARARAQDERSAGGRAEIFVGSDLENYLRYLQLDGRAPLYPWSIRSFSPREIDSLTRTRSTHPWASHFDIAPAPGRPGQLDLDYIRPAATLRFNSDFAYGSNDGPVWAGRGLTTAFQAGVAARWRWFSAKVAPIVFRAENRPFPLLTNGQTGSRRFANGLYPTRIDLPQRFGDTPYTVLDPGESVMRFDTRFVALGLSTADQGWGPATEYPFILGNNAAGFPHAFIGTGSPLDLWLFTLHGRLVYGELVQTSYSIVPPDSVGARRFASGVIAVVEPRGVPGLELGASRFFHSAWPSGGISWSDLRAPFEQVSKRALIVATGDSNDVRNQLASLFFRWVLPHSGFEFYGEFGKDDHNWNVRDAILDPDHAASYMFGLRKIWSTAPDRIIALRGELIDLRFNTLTHTRPLGAGYYTNSELRQGHTERGQLLGADIPGGSGAGAMLALEGYTPRGRWTIEWRRTLSDTAGDYSRTGKLPPKAPEAQQSLGADVLFFHRFVDLHAGLTAVYDINRYFAADRFNLNAILGSRWSW